MKTLLTLFLLLSACKGIDIDESSVNSSTNDSNNTDNSDNSIDNSQTISGGSGSLPGFGNNPSCSGVFGTGFLWKPISESEGSLVVLFPPEYGETFQSVSVTDLLGNVEVGRFSGRTNPNRQTWRFNLPGDAYTGRLVVSNPVGSVLEECVIQIPNPGVRFEN